MESDQRTQFCVFALHKETKFVLALSKLRFALFKIKMQVKKSITTRAARPTRLLYLKLQDDGSNKHAHEIATATQTDVCSFQPVRAVQNAAPACIKLNRKSSTIYFKKT